MLEVYSSKMTTSGWKGLFRQKETPPTPAPAPSRKVERNMNLPEAANFIGVSPDELNKLSEDGTIRRFRTPNGFVYRPKDLEAYKTRPQNTAPQPHEIQWKDMESSF